MKFLNKYDSIVSQSLIRQLNQTLINRKKTLFPVINLGTGERVAKYHQERETTNKYFPSILFALLFQKSDKINIFAA